MRTLAATAILLATAAWSNESRRPVLEDPGRTREEIQHFTEVYRPAIHACYAQHAAGLVTATGKLEITALVLRNGSTLTTKIEAPGVTGKRFRDLDTCVRGEVDNWRFPVSRYDTPIVVPYLFHRFEPVGSGPYYSCWERRGC
jgi:hypothetical protein